MAIGYVRRGSGATDRVWTAWRAHAPLLAAGASAATLAVAFLFGAFVAAGADTYWYVTEALLWLRGNPVQWQSALVIAYLSSQHRTPYLALERTEIEDFRQPFGAAAETLLRAPARRVDPLGLVTIYGPVDVSARR